MNAYHIFKIPQKPVVDLEALKQALHHLSKQHHPDQKTASHQHTPSAWQQVNQAYQILSDDVSRLKHLLELSGIENLQASGSVPEDVMKLFTVMGPKLHQADETICRMDESVTTLEKAMLQQDVLSMSLELQQLATQVGEYQQQILKEVALLDEDWEKEMDCAKLEKQYRQLVYVARWAKQLDEKIFRMMNF